MAREFSHNSILIATFPFYLKLVSAYSIRKVRVLSLRQEKKNIFRLSRFSLFFILFNVQLCKEFICLGPRFYFCEIKKVVCPLCFGKIIKFKNTLNMYILFIQNYLCSRR